MTVKSISTSLLALACAATAFAQLPVRSSSLSRSPSAAASSVTTPYIAPTAQSDDLVESPATNVVKGAFGYTLGAIWDEPIPEDAEPVVVRLSQPRPAFGQSGEVSFSVKPKIPFPPFETVTLCVSTNERRIAAIATQTPRMTLAESYMETEEKIDEIARKTAVNLGIDGFPYAVVTNWGILQLDGYHTSPVIAGKLYREYLKSHPNDPDKDLFHGVSANILKYSSRLIAGSRYNVRRELGDRGYGAPDYLQQIWQLFELAADYYPYAGDVVIRFSVRDVEDRTEHTNLVSIAELKKEMEETAAKRAEESVALSRAPMRPGIVRRGTVRSSASRTEQNSQTEEEKARMETMKKAEQAFKDSLYRLSFAEAVEKAKANDPEALLRLALAFAEGKEVSQNIDKAQEYMELAHSQEYGAAQYVFGLSAGRGMFKKQNNFDRSGHDYYIERNLRWRRSLSKFGWPESVRLFLRKDMYLGGKNLGGEECWYRTQGVSELQRLEREKEVATLAIASFEKAITNGIVIAQESLEFMRQELVDITKEVNKELHKVEQNKASNALKRKNEELLKGAMPDGGSAVATQTNAASRLATSSSATGDNGDATPTNRIQNICGIPLGGKLKEMKGEPHPTISFFSAEEAKNDKFRFDAILIQNVRHFGGWNPTHKIQLLENDFIFSGECTIGDDTIFNAKLVSERYAQGNPWRYVSETEKADSDSSKLVRKLQETLVSKYGEPQYVRQKSDKRPDLSVYAWKNEGLVIILSYDARFYKQAGGLFSDNGEIFLQYIREDLLPKAKAESDAYEAAKKAEAERKAKADAEAWPEEMKKAMESL